MRNSVYSRNALMGRGSLARELTQFIPAMQLEFKRKTGVIDIYANAWVYISAAGNEKSRKWVFRKDPSKRFLGLIIYSFARDFDEASVKRYNSRVLSRINANGRGSFSPESRIIVQKEDRVSVSFPGLYLIYARRAEK